MKAFQLVVFLLEVISLLGCAAHFLRRKGFGDRRNESFTNGWPAKVIGLFTDGLVAIRGALGGAMKCSAETVGSYLDFCVKWVAISVIGALLPVAGVVLGIGLGWSWLSAISTATIAALAFVSYLLIAPFVFAGSVVLGRIPGVRLKLEESSRQVCRMFFYFFFPAFLVALIPPGASVATLGLIVLMIALLAAGATGGLFPMPAIIKPKLAAITLVATLITALTSLFVPNLTTYAGWGFSRSLAAASPRPSLVDISSLSAGTEWFNHANGSANYFYEKLADGTLLVYDAPGVSARSAATLRPLADRDLIDGVVRTSEQLRNRKRMDQLAVEARARLEEERRQRTEKEQIQEQQALAHEREKSALQNRYLVSSTDASEGGVAFGLKCSEPTVREGLNNLLTTKYPATERVQFGVFQPLFFEDQIFEDAWRRGIQALDNLEFDERFSGLVLCKLEMALREASTIDGLSVCTGSLSAKRWAVGRRDWDNWPIIEVKGLGSSTEFAKKDMLAKIVVRIAQELKLEEK